MVATTSTFLLCHSRLLFLNHFLFILTCQLPFYRVSARTAREKVGSYFRDSLHDVYRSSSKAKLARKRSEQEQMSCSDQDQFSDEIAASFRKTASVSSTFQPQQPPAPFVDQFETSAVKVVEQDLLERLQAQRLEQQLQQQEEEEEESFGDPFSCAPFPTLLLHREQPQQPRTVVEQHHPVDIIDMDLLECIAPVGEESFADGRCNSLMQQHLQRQQSVSEDHRYTSFHASTFFDTTAV